MRGMNLIAARLGDVPVLAEKAAHVAARRAHGKDFCAGQEMVQGLLFDGINLQGRGRTVTEAIEFAALIDANETEAALPLPDVTVPGTKEAMHPPVCLRFPPTSLVQRFSFLENLQVLHELSGYQGGAPLPFFSRISNESSYVYNCDNDINPNELSSINDRETGP